MWLATMAPPAGRLRCGAVTVRRARTFSEVAVGQAFWYENSNGLVEIAVNQGRADRVLGLGLGDPITRDADQEAGE